MMCLFGLKKIYYENVRLKSELQKQKEICQSVEYSNRQLRAKIEDYKNQQKLIDKYKSQIDDMRTAFDMFTTGDIDDDTFISFVNGYYGIDDLINLQKKHREYLDMYDMDNLKLQPITLDDDAR